MPAPPLGLQSSRPCTAQGLGTSSVTSGRGLCLGREGRIQLRPLGEALRPPLSYQMTTAQLLRSSCPTTSTTWCSCPSTAATAPRKACVSPCAASPPCRASSYGPTAGDRSGPCATPSSCGGDRRSKRSSASSARAPPRKRLSSSFSRSLPLWLSGSPASVRAAPSMSAGGKRPWAPGVEEHRCAGQKQPPPSPYARHASPVPSAHPHTARSPCS
mmetsp:Transcript_1879/g.5479  ORF Transcript_1879/g.5479 Transcript_1879/m.5479 type:complete len:215 (-) Transcript_1879:1135-1779(-)